MGNSENPIVVIEDPAYNQFMGATFKNNNNIVKISWLTTSSNNIWRY